MQKVVFEDARNPVYANEGGTIINLDVQLEPGGEYMPFTANTYDPEYHGRKLYSLAYGGLFGPVADYVPGPSKTYDVLRREEYPSIGDQLDTIWKQLNYDRLEGRPLIQEADNMLGSILAVKAKHPKPEE